MGLAGIFNTIWMRQCRSEALRFEQAVENPASVQWQVLKSILRRNGSCEYGEQYGFSQIRCVQEYQDRVPICRYDALQDSIHRIGAGQRGVLTAEPVLMFEPTSGTSGGEKWIPYTRSLKVEFQRALAAWVWDTLSMRPKLRRGKSYWSLSPAATSRRVTEAGIPIGFEDDSQYLSRSQRFASSFTLAVSPILARMTELENFRYATLLQLLRAHQLTMVSVWSPTFLIALLEPLEVWWPSICRDLAQGTVLLPTPNATDVALANSLVNRADRVRAKHLEGILAGPTPISEKLAAVWPRLGLISCWTDASAGRYVHEIRERFPGVELQPKGLLATEGVVSIPRVGCSGTALALRSHFLEFAEIVDDTQSEDANLGAVRVAHELECDHEYQVILTTGGGLYRYLLGDVVRVVGRYKECPLIEFLGRASASSDLVGEKLHDRHVREVLERSFADEGVAPDFYLLAPVISAKPGYRVFLQLCRATPSSNSLQALATQVQRGLESNPYYQHACRMGQLDGVGIVVLDSSGEPARNVYESVCVQQGQKAGDIKPVALSPKTDWLNRFAHLIEQSIDFSETALPVSQNSIKGVS